MSQRKYITAKILIIVCTTLIFSALFAREVKELKNYLGYIAENGRSALFHEEFINQNIAYRLSRAFSKQMSSGLNTEKKGKSLCQYVETVGDMKGFNLVERTSILLEGSLQTRNPACEAWGQDVPALSVINIPETNAFSKYSFSNYTGYVFDSTRYYIDLVYSYIYFNHTLNIFEYKFNDWLVDDEGRINLANNLGAGIIDDNALEDLNQGEKIVTHIYKDVYTKRNIISMINPVYIDGKIKGLLITDVNIRELAMSFITNDRPVLWKFLSLYVTDNITGDDIIFHKPILKSTDLLNYKGKMTQYYTLSVKLDAIYVLILTFWLVLLYVMSTGLLLNYARKQFIRQELLSRENITDGLTGLYNRKVLTPELNQKIRSLVDRNIPVTVIAIDCDGLKRINDTLGHHMGDKVIQSLGIALAQSIRKSDYGLRLGGDEFCLILIDNNIDRSRDMIARIEDYLQTIDTDKMVVFSWGSYQMSEDDTLEVAMLKADALLYKHKRIKYEYRK
ncbi:diguanylate cyclase DgcJ [Enterobacter wuhouensis]|uniref:diguanylate cyclase n=1 Tax=Enterobacter wuhouensis TaxID=2529381 RepID=A0ABZ1DGC8_9ENTR|nr:diguanylate cyclase DgcJ [Enterobacter wuhouensis]WRW31674.1 diguanylate cyclase DgcJ [Enterobacter wuhouensis]